MRRSHLGQPRRLARANPTERLPRRGLARPAALAAGSTSASSQVLLLATSAWLITRASQRPPVLLLAVAIGAVQALALTRGLTRYGERLTVHERALRCLGELRLWLFDRLGCLVPGGLTGPSPGSVLGAFVADAEAAVESSARSTITGIEAAAGVLCGTGLLAAVLWPAALVLVAGAVATAVVAAATGGVARAETARVARATTDLVEVILSSLAAAPELAVFGRGDLATEAVTAAGRRAETAERRRARRVGAGRSLALLLVGASVLGILAIGLAARQAGHLDDVALAVAVLAALAALEPLAGLPQVAAALTGGGAATARLVGLAERPTPAPEPTCPVEAPARPAGATLDSAVVERDGGVVLGGLSFSVPPGHRIGLAGPSGSGKTTTVLTLLHFLECRSGAARLGGVDVARLPRAVLAARVGWVPEDTHVFCGTLRANLRLAAPGVDDEACRRALGRVGLGPLLAGLSDGLDTAVGTTGRALSAGERRRLGLARALLADAEVVLLDEPTAHLDPAGVRGTVAKLVAAGVGRALLVVSHDEAVLDGLDGIVRLAGPFEPVKDATLTPSQASGPAHRGRW